MDWMANQVSGVRKDCQVNLDPKEKRVDVETSHTGGGALCSPAPDACRHRASLECRDPQDHLDLQDLQDPKVCMELAAHQVNPASRANQAKTPGFFLD